MTISESRQWSRKGCKTPPQDCPAGTKNAIISLPFGLGGGGTGKEMCFVGASYVYDLQRHV